MLKTILQVPKKNINVRYFSWTFQINNTSKQSSSPAKNSSDEYLKKFYSSELIESIKSAENSISKKHWEAREPSSKFAPPYLDNFKEIDPFWDHLKDEQKDFTYRIQGLTERDIPEGSAILSDGNRGGIDVDGLAKLTGFSTQYIKKLKAKTLVAKMTSNQTRKGKIPSFYALVIVGDGNGMVGIGEGKDKRGVSFAMSKARWNAIKELQHIPRYEDRTILGDIDYRYHGVKLFLRSAPRGFGLRVNHYIYDICQLIGIKDLSGKVYKSRNGMNIAKGLIEALSKTKSLEEIALARGKKVLDLRKTYYSP